MTQWDTLTGLVLSRQLSPDLQLPPTDPELTPAVNFTDRRSAVRAPRMGGAGSGDLEQEGEREFFSDNLLV